MSEMTGAELIAAERERQVTEEKWTPEHDDKHRHGELAEAASCYSDLAAYQASGIAANRTNMERPMGWPWESSWWKPSRDNKRNLIKAGALIAAEIDRLQRMEDGRG